LEVVHEEDAAELLLDELMEIDDEPVDVPKAKDVHDDVITVKGQVWGVNQGRSIDPSLRNACSRSAKMTMHNFIECNELHYFTTCFRDELMPEIANKIIHIGQTMGFGTRFEVTPGDVWLFFGMRMYMLLHAYHGDREDFRMVAHGQSASDGAVVGTLEGTCNVYHNLGRFGMTSVRWRKMTRTFFLQVDAATSGGEPDPVHPIRRFERAWNEKMVKTLRPCRLITVDESMALWKGRGMPGLMTFPRRPTLVGRESHTAADVDTGISLWCEMWEGSTAWGARSRSLSGVRTLQRS
jgi:hypothetical protein